VVGASARAEPRRIEAKRRRQDPRSLALAACGCRGAMSVPNKCTANIREPQRRSLAIPVVRSRLLMVRMK
jgi:hypothetical protein